MSKLSSGGTAAGASSNKSSEGWKKRIIVPTVLAGVVGGGVGLISKHRKALGVGTTAASFAANFAIVTGCYYRCGSVRIKQSTPIHRNFVKLTSSIT
ncbi:uncharacterized protein LOC122027729 isoform X3 [Zingiber officinale]|uniref:uncharacterized protein LOC122027729 isoform X3 n=1 Tax=Zingiber officinale TaxID=94328 RepID=UPI001C4CDF3B|nr:uncharacterized protein LOC122027729 isoform X3 [Zingiber officinale]